MTNTDPDLLEKLMCIEKMLIQLSKWHNLDAELEMVREVIKKANLIAAAPEMLEALEKCLAYLDKWETELDNIGDMGLQHGAAASARLAIARAKGVTDEQ